MLVPYKIITMFYARIKIPGTGIKVENLFPVPMYG